MVDLQSQYEKIQTEINEEIFTVLTSSQFINGKQVSEFATNLAKYLNVKHVIPCGNGTDALQIALMSIGIKPGDEIITPNFTFISTVEVVALLGAKPVLVDVNKDDFTINTEQIEALITDKTKAIVPVHLFGQCANMNEILRIAKKHKLKVIEDTAQAISTDYFINNNPIKAGTIADIGCTSFFPSKNLGCFGDGGAVYTNNDELAEKMHSIGNHGSKKKYYHDRIGLNSRLDTIQAAILKVKLKYLDEYTKHRQAAAIYYDTKLQQIPQVEIPFKRDDSTHTYHQYTIKVPKGENLKLKEYLNSKNIPAMIYYPVAINKQKAFKQYLNDRTCEVSDELSERVISLPMHTELTTKQLKFICSTIEEYFM